MVDGGDGSSWKGFQKSLAMDSGKSNIKRISPVFCEYSMTPLLCTSITVLWGGLHLSIRPITGQVLRKRIRILLSICKWKRLCALHLVSKWWAAEKGEWERRRNEVCTVHSRSEEGRGKLKLSAVGLEASSPLPLGGALHQQQVEVGGMHGGRSRREDYRLLRAECWELGTPNSKDNLNFQV